jgi:hypothetical protein
MAEDAANLRGRSVKLSKYDAQFKALQARELNSSNTSSVAQVCTKSSCWNTNCNDMKDHIFSPDQLKVVSRSPNNA